MVSVDRQELNWFVDKGTTIVGSYKLHFSLAWNKKCVLNIDSLKQKYLTYYEREITLN